MISFLFVGDCYQTFLLCILIRVLGSDFKNQTTLYQCLHLILNEGLIPVWYLNSAVGVICEG